MDRKKNQKRLKRAEAVCRGLEQIWLDASAEEMLDALKHAGEESAVLAEEGRAAVQRAMDAAETEECTVADLHRSLGTLLAMLRRRDQVSVEELAREARVDPTELRRIESDPRFNPHVRTIHKLEKHFALPTRSLVVLSGAVSVQPELREEAQRFAASSSGLSKLSREERKLLNRFVKFLGEHTDE